MSAIVSNGSARSMARTVTPRVRVSPYVSSNSTLRHAGAQECMQIAARAYGDEQASSKCHRVALSIIAASRSEPATLKPMRERLSGIDQNRSHSSCVSSQGDVGPPLARSPESFFDSLNDFEAGESFGYQTTRLHGRKWP